MSGLVSRFPQKSCPPPGSSSSSQAKDKDGGDLLNLNPSRAMTRDEVAFEAAWDNARRQAGLNVPDREDDIDTGRVRRTFLFRAPGKIRIPSDEEYESGFGEKFDENKCDRMEHPVEDTDYFSYLGEFFAGTSMEGGTLHVLDTNDSNLESLEELAEASATNLNSLKRETRFNVYCVGISGKGFINCIWDSDYALMRAIRREIEMTILETVQEGSVELGMLVVAPLGERAEYSRAKIIGFPKNKQVQQVRVEFIDFGIICPVFMKDLSQMPPKLKAIPGIVKSCLHIDVVHKAITLRYVKMLRNFLEGQELCYDFYRMVSSEDEHEGLHWLNDDTKDGPVYGGVFEFKRCKLSLTKEMTKSGMVYPIFPESDSDEEVDAECSSSDAE